MLGGSEFEDGRWKVELGMVGFNDHLFPFSEGVDFCKAKRRGSLTEQIFTHY